MSFCVYHKNHNTLSNKLFQIPTLSYKRAIPNKGPGPVVLFGGALFAICYGYYAVGQGNLLNARRSQEKQNARADIAPFLQAEEDRRFCKEMEIANEEERKIMKNVPNWKVGETVYNGKRWVPPATNDPNLA